jgi:hypothetical protein
MLTVVPLKELHALARWVASDPSVGLRVVPRSLGWFYERRANCIWVDEDDLMGSPPNVVRGLVCHEAAHAAISRYIDFVPAPRLRSPGLVPVLNALEDCRIEAWLHAQFPATRDWIHSANERFFPEDGAGLDAQPWDVQYGLGAVHEWLHGNLPPTLDPEPREALRITQAARAAVIAAQPTEACEQSYRNSQVSLRFRSLDTRQAPTPAERGVRMAGWLAWRRVRHEIWPVVQGVLALEGAS